MTKPGGRAQHTEGPPAIAARGGPEARKEDAMSLNRQRQARDRIRDREGDANRRRLFSGTAIGR